MVTKKPALTTVLFLAKTRTAYNESLIQGIESRDLDKVRLVLTHKPEASSRNLPGDYVPLLLATSLGYDEIVAVLIEAGADVDARNDEQDTALIIASRKGFLKIVDLFIKARAEMDAKNRNQSTALLVAATNGHRAVLEALMGAGANVNAKDHFQLTAIMHASRNGDLPIVLDLLSHGANVDVQDEKRGSSLTYAADQGHHQVVVALIKEGASYKPKDILKRLSTKTKLTVDGHWPIIRLMLLEQAKGLANGGRPQAVDTEVSMELLQRAAKEKQDPLVRDVLNQGGVRLLPRDQALFLAAALGSVVVVRELVANRTAVDSVDGSGKTALIQAAMHGRDAVVEELVLWGAEVNYTDKDKMTPLIWAVKRAHFGAARLLLAHGADVDSTLPDGSSALTIAIEANQAEIVKLLVEHLAANDDCNDGTSLVSRAISLGHHAVARTLIVHGADANDPHAFYVAVDKDDVGGLRVLLNGGADPDMVVRGGETALLLASRLGRPGVATLLMQYDANPSLLDRHGNDALMLAALHKNLKVLTVLLSYGVPMDRYKQDIIAETLAAGGMQKMQIREALTITARGFDPSEGRRKKGPFANAATDHAMGQTLHLFKLAKAERLKQGVTAGDGGGGSSSRLASTVRAKVLSPRSAAVAAGSNR